MIDILIENKIPEIGKFETGLGLFSEPLFGLSKLKSPCLFYLFFGLPTRFTALLTILFVFLINKLKIVILSIYPYDPLLILKNKKPSGNFPKSGIMNTI
ncbi:hypothetical protein BpHYR1_006657 [Brachionus plicatilis]|uniref:Uncharacterized protein n=1 Tax=Brachionus plicatilis TaxID=10195 RepID=A0A3M7R1R5_BRAPC|nr:hypothetical protein BpHYR1_006657 [Brachionus plicatilis]